MIVGTIALCQKCGEILIFVDKTTIQKLEAHMIPDDLLPEDLIAEQLRIRTCKARTGGR